MSSQRQQTILIVDDDQDIASGLEKRLRWLEYKTLTAHDGIAALELIKQQLPDLVLLDLELPLLSGMDVIRRLHEGTTHPHDNSAMSSVPPIIMLTAFATVNRAVEAMKLGAQDFVTKPFNHEHLTVLIKKVLDHQALTKEVLLLRREVGSRYGKLTGQSPAMQQVVNTAKRAAAADVALLVLGETGTGKELLARSIHCWSPRASDPFMAINCAALPETLLENELFGHEKGAFSGATTMEIGKLEAAHGGTVFLDEIGDMPMTLQTRLLRVLQDKEFHRLGGTKAIRVDVRFIAATNRNLGERVTQGQFREDLFYRLNVLPLHIPPLRARGEDIGLLADMIVAREAVNMKLPPKRLTASTHEQLRRYHWPGNVRELENVLSRALILAPEADIDPEHVGLFAAAQSAAPALQEPPPGHPFPDLPFHTAMELYSRNLLVEALRRTNGNQTKAAELLRLQRTYLTKLLKKKGIATKRSDR